MGIRKCNGGENETKVPAIIDEATWDRVNKNLEENKKNPGKRDEYHYLLNGLVFCGICGKEYRGKKRLKGVARKLKYQKILWVLKLMVVGKVNLLLNCGTMN